MSNLYFWTDDKKVVAASSESDDSLDIMGALVPRPSPEHARAGLVRARVEAQSTDTRKKLALRPDAVSDKVEVPKAHDNPAFVNEGSGKESLNREAAMKQEARMALPHPCTAMKQETRMALPHPCAAHSTKKAVMVLDLV